MVDENQVVDEDQVVDENQWWMKIRHLYSDQPMLLIWNSEALMCDINWEGEIILIPASFTTYFKVEINALSGELGCNICCCRSCSYFVVALLCLWSEAHPHPHL